MNIGSMPPFRSINSSNPSSLSRVVVAIPTYNRAHLLRLLIEDLLLQTLEIKWLIVIDGNPLSGEVESLLREMNLKMDVLYVPSNHANLSYQRYLAWLSAKILDVDIIVYFDDDERLVHSNLLHTLVKPILEGNAVGVGCPIRFGMHNDGSGAAYARSVHFGNSLLVRRFGSSRKIASGDTTPVGHRLPPTNNGEAYVEIHWLHGGAMAYSVRALGQDIFSDDLFALDHVRCGLGEDTFLARRVSAHGKLLYTFQVDVEHPNLDTPKSYPSEASRYAFAVAYSRRFLNDHYRIYEEPTILDRVALIRSYFGMVLLATIRALRRPTSHNLAIVYGTVLGILRGLTNPPTAKYLTPEINWWGDAEAAVSIATKIESKFISGI